MDPIDLFLRAAASHPRHAAVAASGEAIAYEDLEERCRRVAARTAALGADKVLIALPQGADAYAAMLGVGLGGGCYAPVNVRAPKDKTLHVARQFEPEMILCSPEDEAWWRESVPGANVTTPRAIRRVAPLTEARPRNTLAYVIFTSGSTGRPKGVAIPRGALDHYVAWLGDAFAITADDRVSQHPNIAFDLSVMDIYGGLCRGATLCPIVSPGDRLMPARALARERITIWISVPSVISLMTRARQATAENLRSVRLFAFCGEPLAREHLDALFTARPAARVVNTYGPTEATVSMTALPLSANDYHGACAASVALGDPIPGMDLRLVGGANPDEGEIVITGPQLAAGYWRDPEATAKAFRTLDIDGRPTRAYFTGDWARRVGAQIYFEGRVDFQVKVRGHRLELEEVAGAIRALGWPDARALIWRGELTAVVEAEKIDAERLRRDLIGRIEGHAIPTVIRAIPAMPRSDNDKIDQAAIVRWLEADAPSGVAS
jgi:D-alanine--poly(phosphoribitol) ligase subunit 1